VQHQSLFHLPLSDLRSDWYSLSGCEIKAQFKRNWRVFDRDPTNTCRIANLKPGGERATKTAQSTYWSCCDTIRTQILNWSKKCWLFSIGFCVETRCNGSVPGWNRTRNRPGNLDPLLTLVAAKKNSCVAEMTHPIWHLLFNVSMLNRYERAATTTPWLFCSVGSCLYEKCSQLYTKC